jgi:acyl-homoserine lactone acylase PvdQ
VRTGTLYLESAMGKATFIREASTGIHHIKADSKLLALYT